MNDEHDTPRPPNLFLLAFFFELALVPVALMLGLLTRGRAFPFHLSLDFPGLAWGLVAAVPMALLAFFTCSDVGLRLGPLQRIQQRIKSILGDTIRELSRLDILLLAFAAGIGEEVLFRGVIQTISGTQGFWIASLLFGILHALTLTYFLLALLMGAYFGWLFQASGNLLAPILVHSIFDAVSLWLLQRRFHRDNTAATQPTLPEEE